MRIAFCFFLSVLSVKVYAQCNPTTGVKAIMCPNLRDSASVCPRCMECRPGIMASDTSYSVTGFKMILQSTNAGLPVTNEVETSGPLFQGAARKLLTEIKAGDIIYITCVRAQYKNGKTFILQPYTFEVK